MKKKLFVCLLVGLSFLSLIKSNLMFVSAATDCLECTDEILCEIHSEDFSKESSEYTSPNSFSGIIVEDENDEGIVLLGDEEPVAEVCRNGGIIVEDENDEGIVLLGNEEPAAETCSNGGIIVEN